MPGYPPFHSFFVWWKCRKLEELVAARFRQKDRLRVLDAGCGEGTAEEILKRKGWEIVGVDVSENLVQEARRRVGEAEFVVGDVCKLPFTSKSFDVCFSMGLFHHIRPSFRRRALGELVRVLRKGGLIVAFDSSPENLIGIVFQQLFETDKDAVLMRRKEAVELYREAGLKEVREGEVLLGAQWFATGVRG